MYAHHYDSSAHVLAEPETLFLYLDDQERLSAHMMQSSAMTAGMKMRFDFDAQRGRKVGSKIRLSGKFFGLSLGLVEVVTKRELPLRQIWETVGEPHMLVIGSFRMGFHEDLGELRGQFRWHAQGRAGIQFDGGQMTLS